MLYKIRDISFGSDGKVPELDRPISWEEVHAVLVRLRPGSAADPEGLVAEVLIHAGIGFAVSLLLLFNALWARLEWPAKWFEA